VLSVDGYIRWHYISVWLVSCKRGRCQYHDRRRRRRWFFLTYFLSLSRSQNNIKFMYKIQLYPTFLNFTTFNKSFVPYNKGVDYNVLLHTHITLTTVHLLQVLFAHKKYISLLCYIWVWHFLYKSYNQGWTVNNFFSTDIWSYCLFFDTRKILTMPAHKVSNDTSVLSCKSNSEFDKCDMFTSC
jgi:hypothetical protein